MPQNHSLAADLSGVLDGIRARNLATIERNTALQVSELQIRLQLMRKALSTAEKTALVSKIDDLSASLRDPSKTIVDRLTTVGEGLRDVLLQNAVDFPAGSVQLQHAEWVVRRFVEAAELAHQDKVTNVALLLGETLQQITG